MIKQAEWIAGLELTEAERASTARSVAQSLRTFAELRKVDVGYDVPPALTFFPKPPQPSGGIRRNQAHPAETRTIRRPDRAEDLAFLPVTELSALVRGRQVSSTELTKLYLERLKRFDPLLLCVVTLTEDLALKQAVQADKEIAAGSYRGPLHGIPWGAKDLIAYPGYPTTWGATPFKKRVIDAKATVAARLEEAGAVLVAKLSLGALAMGDLWFGGRTRSPWDPRAGSSGSSAGSRVRRGRGPGRVRDRQRDLGQHRVALPRLRRNRAASHIRPREPARVHDPVLVHGQAGADRAVDRGLRTRIRRHPRGRWTRSSGRRSAVRMAAQGAVRAHQDRLYRGPRPTDRRTR
jgi:hypothetical protein